MILWAVSLILEAALAVTLTRRGGFPAFVRFLWYDVATQALGMALSGSGAWYPLVHRWSEAGAVVLLAFVVREATGQMRPHDAGRLLACCAAVAIGIHLTFAASVPWSIWASGVWQLVALSHSIMGLYVGASTRSTHGSILTFWLLADAALFYVAPHYSIGMAVLWLNTLTWSFTYVVRYCDMRPVNKN